MSKGARIAVIVATPIVGLATLVALPRPVDLLVDNGTQGPLQVEVDGEVRVVVPRDAVARLTVHAGARHLRGITTGPNGEPGPLADDQEVTLAASFFAPRPAWVWNVGGQTSAYYVVGKGYGTQESLPAEPFAPPASVFRLPDGLLPMLDGDFPREVKEPRRPDGSEATGALRRALFTDRFIARKRFELLARQFTPESVEAAAIEQGIDLPGAEATPPPPGDGLQLGGPSEPVAPSEAGPFPPLPGE